MDINFSELSSKVEIKNFKTGETGVLQPLDDSCIISEEDVKRIAEICNSSKVFDLLFADMEIFKGKRYETKDAEFFINDKSRKEWKEKKAFVYVVKDSSDKIVCAVDIKSTETDGAEIGYWAAEDSPGWMTNSVVALESIAKKAGYKRLFALVRKGNNASGRVLIRADFVEKGIEKKNGDFYTRYELELDKVPYTSSCWKINN